MIARPISLLPRLVPTRALLEHTRSMTLADPTPDTLLTATEARALGCLIEKEFTTPDIYPLSLNSLTNACNQRSNRAPILTLNDGEVEQALDGLRQKRLAALFSGADARVPKFRQTLDNEYPMETAARALLAELLLRGPQTTAELRARAERMHPLADLAEAERLLSDLAARPAGALVRLLPRQPGQKEQRWAELLTGEPSLPATPSLANASLPSPSQVPAASSVQSPSPEIEQRIAALESEVASLRSELAALRAALGDA